MRRPSRIADNGQSVDPLKEERADAWHPDRISDRQLLELTNRLANVQQLGGAFAKIGFSPQAQKRLEGTLAAGEHN